MISNKWFRVFGVLAVGVCSGVNTGAYAQRDDAQRVIEAIPAGTAYGGVIPDRGPTPAGVTEVIYDNAAQATPVFWTSPVGSLAADDISTTLGPDGGIMGSYTLDVFGSTTVHANCPAEAAILYSVTTSLWADLEGPGFFPFAPIPGTTCTFAGVPKGSFFTLDCPVNRFMPGSFWLVVEFDSNCAGWVEAGAGPPDVGFSDGLILGASVDGGATWGSFFIDCAPSEEPCHWNMVSTMLGPDPGIWSCCDTSDHSCVNVGVVDCLDVNQIFAPGVLCNDLDPPCSASGACCDIATGQCQVSFEVDCGGFLERFTEGETCQNVDCQSPDNVPAVTHWGMIVLSLLLLTALTIKFARRRAKCASLQN